MSKKKEEFNNDTEVLANENPQSPGTFNEKVEDSTEKKSPVSGDFNPPKPKETPAPVVQASPAKQPKPEKSAVEDISGSVMVSLTKNGRLISRRDMTIPQIVKELNKDKELNALIKGQRFVRLLGESYPGFKSRIRYN